MFKNGKVYPGMPMQFTLSITDSAGSAVDPDTVTAKVMSPCGGESTYVYGTDDEVARSAAGVYTLDITPDRAGRWHIRWLTTGTGKTVVQEESFIVQSSPFVASCSDLEDYV